MLTRMWQYERNAYAAERGRLADAAANKLLAVAAVPPTPQLCPLECVPPSLWSAMPTPPNVDG